MKSKCCGAEVVSTLYFNKPSKDFCKKCDRECEVVGDCEGCKWEEARKLHLLGETIIKDPADGDIVIESEPIACLNCSRHYAQLKDNYQSK